MKDSLAEWLYNTFVENLDDWETLDIYGRARWERVAAKARRVMLDRAVAEIANVEEMRISDGDDALDELRRRFAK